MKILHVHLSGEFAGSERYCAGLARGQALAGDKVLVVVRDSAVLARWRREAHPAEVVTVPRWVPAFAERWVVGKILRGFEPDVVHTHLGRANLRGGRAAKAAGVPWVATVHLRWKGKEMAGANGVICVAGWQKAEIPADYSGQVSVVWNWVGQERRSAGAEEQRVLGVRGGWGCGPHTFVFGSVGRLHRQKGMDVLIEAFRKAFAGGEDVKLVLVGGGKEEEALRAITDDQRVVFAGYQEAVEYFYRAFDVYVSAARYEPFGLTILEAMQAQKPLVCTKTEGPSEFLKNNLDVVWAEREDVDSLAAALRGEYEHGRRRVEYDMRPFSLERGVREVRAMYDKVVGV